MAWTSSAHVLDAWIGSDKPTDPVLVDRWISKAEREIRYRVPDVQARIDLQAAEVPARTELLESVRDVVASMVARVFRNPEGIRTVNQSSGTGPFSESVSRTYGGDVPGGLGMTDGEVSRLRGSRSGRAFTVSMIPVSSEFYSRPL